MLRHTLHAITLVVLTILIGWIETPSADASGEPPKSEDVEKWVVDRMIAWSRPGITLHPPAMESFDDGKARYELIANAVLRIVARDKPLFGGPKGRVRTAALILAISMFESGFRKDVDMNLGNEGRGDSGRSWCLMQIQLGIPIYIDASGKRVTPVKVCKDTMSSNGVRMTKKCEYAPPEGARESTPSRIVFVGNSYEITTDQTRGYSGQDLIADRELCFSAGLRIIRNSFYACKQLPVLERLSAYASGNCEDGREASRRRVGCAVRWIDQNPPPINDVHLVRLFSSESYNASTVANMGNGEPTTAFMPLESSWAYSKPLALLP